MEIQRVLLTLAVAALGSFAGARAKVPAGAMTGAIFTVGLLQIATGLALFPASVKLLSSSLTGAYLGSRVNRRDVLALKGIVLPAVAMILCMMAYNFFLRMGA